MKPRRILFLALVACACASYAGGRAEWTSYPKEGIVYKFEVHAGEKDRWDSAKRDAPPLAPGKAARLAKKFAATIPLSEDMKGWTVEEITLTRLSPGPQEEWVYVVHFNAVPKPDVFNGPVPWIDVPVRMDGTVPRALVDRKKS